MIHVLSKSIVPVLIFLLLAGCSKQDQQQLPDKKKQEYTCSYSYVYVKEELAFSGFTAAELGAVVLQKFELESNFGVMLDSDTLDASGAQFSGDTAYTTVNGSYYRGFFSLNDSADYKIKVLNANREYVVSLKSGKAFETWTQDAPCSAGSSQTRYVPFITTLDSHLYEPYGFFNSFPVLWYFICLRR
jgi:hypothetical protein